MTQIQANNLKVYVDGVWKVNLQEASFSVNSFRIGSNNNGNGGSIMETLICYVFGIPH